MKLTLLLLCLSLISLNVFAEEYKLDEDQVIFTGRISKVNPTAKLIRIKIDFENAKFLSKNHRIEIWNDSSNKNKCLTYLEGRSNEYLLVRVPNYNNCILRVQMSTGSYIHMYSPNLENSLIVAKELVEILNRKRTALDARLSRFQRKVDGYIEKIDVTNKRYEVLRQKLELEWQLEISNLEDDKVKNYENYKHTQAKLHELQFKMQQYRVRDQNMKVDRWSLDPKLYYKK
jgi:hypothetical protein